jgi:hypothetical protein
MPPKPVDKAARAKVTKAASANPAPPLAKRDRTSHPLERLARGSDVDLERLETAHKKLVRQLLLHSPRKTRSKEHAASNILGVGIGEKLRQGKATGQPSLRVYVRAKTPAKMVAGQFRVPKQIDGFATDVIEMLPFVASNEESPQPSAQPGESIRHEHGTFGTFGCLVATRDNTLCVLGNQHVIGLENNAQRDDLVRFQPAIMTVDYPIARFVKGLPIGFAGPVNGCDAAIARTDPSLVLPTFPSGETINSVIVSPQVNMPVHKFGRHGHTVGVITDVHAQETVFFEGRPATFGGQIRIESTTDGAFSVAGDSGAILLTVAGNHPVGLLFAAAGTSSLANPFGFVLKQLGSNGVPLRLITSGV